MKVLVTGGAGFIGSYLAESLVMDGYTVVVVDDLSTGRRENIAHLEGKENFTFWEGNILNYKLMLKLITESDCVYHCAAAVGVKYVVEHPLESLVVNVRGTEIIFELAYVFKKKVFLASSSEVYGKNGTRPFKETDDRILGAVNIPRWGYAISKGFDEFLASAYYKSKGLPVVVGRLFNICGPRQSPHYGMVIPRFVSQALNNEPITVYGDGKQVRAFTYITDTVSAIRALMDEPRAEGEIFNIGSAYSVSINELAKKIIEITGSGSKIVNVPYAQAYDENFEDMFYRIPDISKISSLISFAPKMKLDEMLKLIINDHRGR